MTTLVGAEVPRVRTLDANDRCDSCGSQAYVVVRMDAGELLFCAHHAREYDDLIGFRIVLDERAKLDA